MASWSWQLTDLNFNPIGEFQNAHEMKLQLPQGKVKTASLILRLDNPLVPYAAECEGCVKVYREKQLLFFGPIQTAQEVGNAGTDTFAINASGPEFIFAKRLTGKTAAGIVVAAKAFANGALIFTNLLDASNTESETNIDYLSGPISGGIAAGEVGYKATPFKYLSEVLNDLSNTADGFDWRVLPLENIASGQVASPKIGRFESAELLSSEQANAVFEYGAGRANVATFTRGASRTTQINRAYHIGPSGPEATESPTESAEDSGSRTKWKLMEEVVNATILNNQLRLALCEENVAVRKNPRQTVIFQPASDLVASVPILGRDFNVGDTVRLRLMPGGIKRLDVAVRVWGVEFTLDENLKEQQIITTEAEAG